MSQHTHTCLKCTQSYQDEDVEAYYCPACLEEHKKMAALIDANRTKTERMPSEIENYMNDPRTVIKNGGHSIFIRESQL